MLAITLGGQMGAGCPEVGGRLARDIGGSYVELSALRHTTRRLNATVEAVVRKELAYGNRWTRFGHTLERWFDNMGRYPVDSTIDGMLWIEPMAHRGSLKKTLPAQISDDDYKAAIFDTAADYARVPNVVLGRRAGCVALREVPDVIHIGLFAPLDARISRTCNRLGIGPGEAREVLRHLERARAGWFDHLGNAHPHDTALYDFTVDCTKFPNEHMASRWIRNVVHEIRFGSTDQMLMSDGYYDVT